MSMVRLARAAVRQPDRILPALAARLAPRSRYGHSFVRRADGFFTFTARGFVSAPNPAMLLARHNWEVSYIRRLLGGVRAGRSLEIGCGYGRLSPVIAEFSGDHTAVDINGPALATARSAYPGVRFCECSATALPFADGAFGLVTTWTVLQHIPPERIGPALAEIQRVLRPGGTLLMCEETRHVGGTAPHTWHRPLEFYESALRPLRLRAESYIGEIDRIPGMESPGRVMLFACE